MVMPPLIDDLLSQVMPPAEGEGAGCWNGGGDANK